MVLFAVTVKFVASVAVAALPVVFWFRVATRAAAIVPDAMFEPLSAVKLAPLPDKFVAVISPVILILPVPVIFLLFKSRFPPSCGVVS